MTETITLTDGRTFKIPDGYYIDILCDGVYNQIDDETIKITLLSVNNDDGDTPIENVRERLYQLDKIISFGDEIDGCL